ncbi:MAG: class D sortase [Bryobacteraceae bacterium]
MTAPGIARRLEWTFLTIGFIFAGWYFYSLAESQIFQVYENYKIDQDISVRQRSQNRAVIKAAPRPGSGAVIGRIEIPRVSVSAVVREGADDKTLKRSAGHVPDTALPGENGNVGIAAHRDTYFRNLKGIRNGDRIRMVTSFATYEYEVETLKIVLPENVEVLNPTRHRSLTLVTCYPFSYVGSAPKRFIVHARQVDFLANSGS